MTPQRPHRRRIHSQICRSFEKIQQKELFTPENQEAIAQFCQQPAIQKSSQLPDNIKCNACTGYGFGAWQKTRKAKTQGQISESKKLIKTLRSFHREEEEDDGST